MLIPFNDILAALTIGKYPSKLYIPGRNHISVCDAKYLQKLLVMLDHE